jgi:hypothetical protein
MKVYILHYQKWEDQYIVGVFTTCALAEKYLKDLEESSTKKSGFNRANYAIITETLIGE